MIIQFFAVLYGCAFVPTHHSYIDMLFTYLMSDSRFKFYNLSLCTTSFFILEDNNIH